MTRTPRGSVGAAARRSPLSRILNFSKIAKFRKVFNYSQRRFVLYPELMRVEASDSSVDGPAATALLWSSPREAETLPAAQRTP